ncbi:MAG TPA: hypothetical protein VGI74_07935 [Streptosporangiaceae bacterium]
MTAEPDRKRWHVMATAKRAAASYRANREDLEPFIRVAADLLALAALLHRRRSAPSSEAAAKGTCA